MSLPADIHMTTVTGTAVRADGSIASGAVVAFSMPSWLVDTTSHAAVVPRVFSCVADGSGAWSMAVIATDQAQISPLNWAYTLTINDAGTMLTYGTVQVPTSPSTTTFDALVPTGVVVGSPNLYVPLATKAVANGVASLGSDGKVPAGQLPAASGGTAVNSVTSGDSTTITIGGTATDPTVKVAAPAVALITGALQLAPADPAALAYDCHACNFDPAAAFQNSTINEQWFMRILVRAGRQINLVKTLVRVAGTAGAGGLNGFSLYSDDFTTLLWNSVSDDTLWTAAAGEVSKAVTGSLAGMTNRTPAVDTWLRVGISARGHTAAPNFAFANFSGSSAVSDAGHYRCRYRASAYGAWPASIVPATDLGGVAGFVPPVLIG
jgi:hypothetical protein